MSRKVILRSEPDEKITRKKWNKKYLIRTIIQASIATIALQGYNHLKLFIDLEQNEQVRYLSQAIWLVMIVCYILAVFSFRKALPKIIREYMTGGLRWAFQKIGVGFGKLGAKLRHMLGFGSRGSRIRGRDEKSFEFDSDDNGLLRRFRNMRNQLRWRDLTENSDKIRFLYIKFINRLTSKKLLKYNAVLTPNELAGTVALKPGEDGNMFGLYTGARYSGGIYPISDEDVENAIKVANGK